MQQQCSPGSVVQDLSSAATAAEIDSLCSRSVRGSLSIKRRPLTLFPQSLGKDEPLRSFASDHLASSHLYLAFHAHQAQLPSAAESTSTEALQALRILASALEQDLPTSPSAPLKKAATPVRPVVEKKAAPTTTRRRGTVKSAAALAKEEKEKKALAYKTPQVSRTLPGSKRVVLDLVTPPSSRDRFGAEDERPSVKSAPLALAVEHPERCYRAFGECFDALLGPSS